MSVTTSSRALLVSCIVGSANVSAAQNAESEPAANAQTSAVDAADGANATDAGDAPGYAESSREEDLDREARSLFHAGTVAFQDGRFEDALRRWREAYESSPRPRLLFNIGTAFDRLGRAAEAADYFERYLAESPDADNRNSVMRRITLLRQRVATESRATAAREPEPAPQSTSRVGPITLFAGAGAAGIGALVTGLIANAKYMDIDKRCVEQRCPPDIESDRDSLRVFTTTTDVLLAATVALAAAGLVWWLVGSAGSDHGNRGRSFNHSIDMRSARMLSERDLLTKTDPPDIGAFRRAPWVSVAATTRGGPVALLGVASGREPMRP